jgi:hypothetical protein
VFAVLERDRDLKGMLEHCYSIRTENKQLPVFDTIATKDRIPCCKRQEMSSKLHYKICLNGYCRIKKK